jgi:hypothetical protein
MSCPINLQLLEVGWRNQHQAISKEMYNKIMELTYLYLIILIKAQSLRIQQWVKIETRVFHLKPTFISTVV